MIKRGLLLSLDGWGNDERLKDFCGNPADAVGNVIEKAREGEIERTSNDIAGPGDKRGGYNEGGDYVISMDARLILTKEQPLSSGSASFLFA